MHPLCVVHAASEMQQREQAYHKLEIVCLIAGFWEVVQGKHLGPNERVPSAGAHSFCVAGLRVAVRKGIAKQEVPNAPRTNIHEILETHGFHALRLDRSDSHLQNVASFHKPLVLALHHWHALFAVYIYVHGVDHTTYD